MKYTYFYKTSDGVRHEAAMNAASRDEVFLTLRKQGIKAIKVIAADGSKANGEVRGVRKRMVFAIAVAVAVVVGVVAFICGESSGPSIGPSGNPSATPRHQIYGDPAIVNNFERGRFDDVLTSLGDRYLAWFAQPGKLMCPKDTTLAELRKMPANVVADLERTLDADVAIGESDVREVRELKQIVNGIRGELREYLANGNGTVRSFGRRLYERTQQEIQIYERTRRELATETKSSVWKAKNDSLRALGIRTIPNPHEQ